MMKTNSNTAEAGTKLDHYSTEFVDSSLSYNCGLNVFADYLSFRGTQIVCTIGPACANVDTIVDMINSGMRIARFNFSHGSHEDQKKMMDIVKTASKKVSTIQPIALALDTKGPEIRTGLNKDGANIVLVKDESIVITTNDSFKESSTKDQLYIDYKSLASSIKIGQIILVADGSVVIKVTEIKGNDVVGKILSGATFGSRKNVCLPMVKTNLPALSEKDILDIKFGMEQNVDIIFASFIRSAQNVEEIRKICGTTESGKKIKIISKIENYEGVMDIDNIIEASDGVMVARGDLGMDLDLEKVVVAQKMIIAKCNCKGRTVICATQMLETMSYSIRPTRAEIADVTNAVLDGADCVMLSGETANGKYPVDAVKTMQLICHAAEKMNRTNRLFEDLTNSFFIMSGSQATAMAAVNMAYKLRADGIVLLTSTGETARLISMFRPRCVILAVTRNEQVSRSCLLLRNLCPLLYTSERAKSWVDDVDARLKFAVKFACEKKYVTKKSTIIFVTGWKSGPGSSNSVRVISVDENYSVSGLS